MEPVIRFPNNPDQIPKGMVQKRRVGGCVTHFRYIRGIELKLSGITPGV